MKDITRKPNVLVAVRLPPALLARVDELVGEKCVTRAEAIRRLLAAEREEQGEAA